MPGSTSGAEENFAASLPQATIEPVKVTAPMNTPITTSAWWMPSRSAGNPAPPCASTSRYPFQPTRTAARPTKLWNSAISSGMPVIGTRPARIRPITAPISPAAISNPVPSGSIPSVSAMTRVVSRAIAMPAIPNPLPARAVSCRDSPARARMNSSAATV